MDIHSFGDPEQFAIDIDLRGRKYRRVYGCARLWVGGHELGNFRQTIKVKDVAEVLDESRYCLPICDGQGFAEWSAQRCLDLI